MTDEDLLKEYWKGFNAYLDNEPLPETHSYPFRVGYVNAHYGEDIRSLDYMSEAQIIDMVRNKPIAELE